MTNSRFWQVSMAWPLAVTLVFAIAILGSLGSASARGNTIAKPAALNSGSDRVVSAAIESEEGVVQNYFVVWQCPDNYGLCEAIYNGHVWLRNEIPHMGQLRSSPTIAIGLDTRQAKGQYPIQYVFWQGLAPHYWLTEAWWNGSWHGPIHIKSAGKLGGDPTVSQVYIDSAVGGGDMIVAWEGTDGNLWYSKSSDPTNASSWSKAVNRKVGKVFGPPALIDAGGDAVIAFWAGDNGHLYAASLSSNTTLGDYPFGPCDFNVGAQGTATAVGSAPTVTWASGILIGVRPVLTLASPGAPTARLTGNCPRDDWWGNAIGTYFVCWGAETTTGLRCLLWYYESKAELYGPAQIGHMGTLGSAPAVTAYPPADDTRTLGFWSSGGFYPKLIMADVADAGPPQNTGVKLYP
jgi:hypothetical protein